MGSFTAVPYPTSEVRVLITNNHPVAAGDQIVLTVDGAKIPYTIQAADLETKNTIFLKGATNWAAAVSAATATDPLHNLPMKQVIFATPGLQQKVGTATAQQLWIGISTRHQFTKPATVTAKFVPVHSAANALTFAVQTHSVDTLITVTEPIAAGTVLTTTIDGVVSTYAVASGETADSITGHIHDGLTKDPRWTTRINANTITVIDGTTVAGGTTVTVGMAAPTEKATLYVSGRFLYDRRGNQVVLRGVNYPVADDPQFPGADFLSEIAQSGANAVRIPWYTVYPNDQNRAQILTPAVLGAFLDECVKARILPIVELADIPCPTEAGALNTQLVPWWTSAEVKAVLLPRQSYLILNLANELGVYQWADTLESGLADFVAAYKPGIASMRAAGYTLPLMIDAPDCGMSLNAFMECGAELVAADPLGNLLLSTHAYWAGYDGSSLLEPMVEANLPLIFAEISNKQDETIDNKNVYGYYGIDGTNQPHAPLTTYNYTLFLPQLQTYQMGWLAWCWTFDYCDARQMTSSGKFADLGTYGQDIVNNPAYGLKATAKPIAP